MTPGIAAVPRRPPHPPTNPPAEAAELGPLISFTRSNLAVHWDSATSGPKLRKLAVGK
jgi:hypothetical protein